MHITQLQSFYNTSTFFGEGEGVESPVGPAEQQQGGGTMKRGQATETSTMNVRKTRKVEAMGTKFVRRICNVDTVDHFNNMKIYPRLQSLLRKNYFRFYKVNLNRECPFWSDDSRCAIRYCHVEPCLDVNVYEEFARWEAYDDAQDNFCDTNEEDDDIEYVDLLLNPERYTGYKGKSAHRIWHSIYMENCFRPKNSYGAYIQTSKLSGMCLEKRTFYRTISGLHTSINLHLCSKYLLSEQNSLISHPDGKWGANLEEFHRRFDPELTAGEGPQWLKNLYFLYLLELRALAKAAPYLMREEYFTGNDQEDVEVRQAIKDFLNIVRSFPDHFNESSMFTGGKQAKKLKEEFRQHFRNISRIMDCVGCDKCKLWGKLQIQGLGTALKILFSGKFDAVDPSGADLSQMSKNKFQLQRSEIVALFNAFGRLKQNITNNCTIKHFQLFPPLPFQQFFLNLFGSLINTKIN
uniref:Ero1-like protein n=1 Tax=Timema monikensis TaxID=170555 RepID=A0A7R9E6P2_9NEOP|nr:unnamed protein product [Timema monikensis]